MQGYVPITKENLLTMIAECREAVDKQYFELFDKQVKYEKAMETLRTTKRKWYRLWILPQPQFNLSDENSLLEFSANRSYPMFETCPFDVIKQHKAHAKAWLDNLANLATSDYAGEPIQLDIKTFQRVSMPYKHKWVTMSYFVMLY